MIPSLRAKWGRGLNFDGDPSVALNERSQLNAKGLKPQLVEILELASEMAAHEEERFTVIQGVRSREDMCINWGKGRSATECTRAGVPAHYAKPEADKVTWLKHPFGSNHRTMKDGYGWAFDVYPHKGGKVYVPRKEEALAMLAPIAALLKRAAAKLGYARNFVWGGDWKTTKDFPHFEWKE